MINQQQLLNLIPLACEWVEEQEQIILKNGSPLSEKQMFIASKIGIININKIRLKKVDFIPEPTNDLLNMANKSLGLISSDTIGTAYRYGIYIQEEYWENDRLLIHELTHTLQYERLGGVANFLNQYIKECDYFGYEKSKLEIEARDLEIKLQEIVNQYLIQNQ